MSNQSLQQLLMKVYCLLRAFIWNFHMGYANIPSCFQKTMFCHGDAEKLFYKSINPTKMTLIDKQIVHNS